MTSRAIDWYDHHGETLVEAYESLDFSAVHGWLLDLLPQSRGAVLDVGAGTGRDAAAMAELGHDVVAVDPSSTMLREASLLHPGKGVRWLDDRLPSLEATHRTGLAFDLILLSGVWQHVAPGERPRAFRKLVTLLKPGGVLAITLRMGPAEHKRDMHEVSFSEIESLAKEHGAFIQRHVESEDQRGRSELRWIQVAVRLPDDGTGALPLLRHVILQDVKSSTYKLALLRAVARIADGAAGLVRQSGTDHVSIPLGLVALYWIRLYLPLLSADLPQSPGNKGLSGLGFVCDGFSKLLEFAPNDLRVGTRFDAKRSASLHEALVAAARTIAKMPAHHMTHPNGQPVMRAAAGRPGRARTTLIVDEPYLRTFGEMLVPGHLWRAMSRYDAWIEPAIVAEWKRLIEIYARGQSRTVSEGRVATSMRWSSPERAVSEARQRAIAIIGSGKSLHCVWSGKRLTIDGLDIDHCFPWMAWPCDDLWNLLPSTRTVNQHEKRERLPSESVLMGARERMEEWWNKGYLPDGDLLASNRFFLEARTSLPMINAINNSIGTTDVFNAVGFQRLRLKENQQIPEWAGPKR